MLRVFLQILFMTSPGLHKVVKNLDIFSQEVPDWNYLEYFEQYPTVLLDMKVYILLSQSFQYGIFVILMSLLSSFNNYYHRIFAPQHSLNPSNLKCTSYGWIRRISFSKLKVQKSKKLALCMTPCCSGVQKDIRKWIYATQQC